MTAIPRVLRYLGYAVAGVVWLCAVGLAALMVVVWFKDRPPDVPDDFSAPTQLPPAGAPAPEGSLFFDSDRTGSFEIYRTTVDGGEPVALTHDPKWDLWWPRLSPDRTRILFYRTPAGVHDTDFGKTHLWVMNVDGTGQVELRPPGLDGWAQQGHAEWSPDGTHLVMFGGKNTNPQIFLTEATGQHPVAITDRGGANLDPSFSPDGHTIAFVGCPSSICFPDDYELYVVDTKGAGDPVRLTHDGMRDHDPYFSPDGRRIAWLTNTSGSPAPTGSWNIRLANADGSGMRLVTDDDNVNSKPDWSPDGKTLFFHRLDVGVDEVFNLFAIEIDGSNLRAITPGQPGVNEFPSTR
jgi:Tol biopolymer transport system component